MSLASDWASAINSEDQSSAAQELLKPEGFGLEDTSDVYFSAIVTHEGGLNIERGGVLTSEQAIALAQWISLTFMGVMFCLVLSGIHNGNL